MARHHKIGLIAVALFSLLICMGSLMVSIEQPEPIQRTRRSPVLLEVPVEGLAMTATFSIDGRAVPTQLSWRQGARAELELEEGEYQVELQVGTALPFHSLKAGFKLVVDRSEPAWQPDTVAEYHAGSTWQLSGTTEPGVRVRTLEGELGTSFADEEGRLSTEIPLQPGWNDLQLSLVDPAGNVTLWEHRIFSDLESPAVVTEPADGERTESARPVLRLRPRDDGKVVRVTATIDEQPLTLKDKGDGLWAVQTGRLPEGNRRLLVRVEDAAGRVSERETWFVVDSTEDFGKAVLTAGAVGADVKALQQRLAEVRLLKKEELSGVFDLATERAVRQFQEKKDFEPTGIADQQVLVALGPRIFINQSHFSLVLDRPGKPLVRFSVATGSPSYPTPNGEFTVVEKVYHPTWLPPESDWAKGQKPIPPGPGNPLGTRWIGLDWGGVGIHGTNAPWSIGSRASHGCLRMTIPDVESLFEMVEPGTRVTILGGWEQHPALERYWPSPKSKEAS